jgi:cysteine synthase
MQYRPLSPRLNPYASEGIEMCAFIPFGLFPHIKSIPALWMMREDFVNGLYEDVDVLVVDSSGNTVDAVGRLAPAFGIRQVVAVVSSDVPDSKLGILDALSTIKVIKAPWGLTPAQVAREEGAKPRHRHLNQYAHPANLDAHASFTGPEITRIMHELGGRHLGMISIAMGSSGTAAGVGKFLGIASPSTEVIGARPVLGAQVPGARDVKKMAEVVTLPWPDYVGHVMELSRHAAFVHMRQLWSEVEPRPGPSSGLAWGSLLAYLETIGKEGRERLRGSVVGFLCADDGRFYSDVTKAELDSGEGVAE